MASRRVELPRARSLVVISTFTLFSACGPYHEGGGGEGAAGNGAAGEGAAGTSAGTGGGGAGGGAGSTGAAGSVGAGATVGSGGNSGSAGGASFPDSVIGCEPATWPESGLFFRPPPLGETPTEEELLLSLSHPSGLSGDGKVVVGATSLPPYRSIAVSWTLRDGLVLLPPVVVSETGEGGFEAFGFQASCDGSVILQKDAGPFGLIYRTVGDDAAPDILHDSPFSWEVHMSPDGAVVVDGGGFTNEFGTTPQRWTTSKGSELLPGLFNERVYGLEPEGTLIAGNADMLFEYDVEADARTPLGMADVIFSSWSSLLSLRVSASGRAWAQSADQNFDSFLVWRPPAEPRSVTCSERCEVVDLSGTGEVVLVDSLGSTTQSLLWTERTGFIDLTSAVTQMGVELGESKLRAVAISDDGRVLTGSFVGPYGSGGFFYVVLPATLFE